MYKRATLEVCHIVDVADPASGTQQDAPLVPF